MVALVLGLWPQASRAQTPIKLGRVTFRPTLKVSNLGFDTNVFNEAVNPKRDTTFSVRGITEMQFRVRGGEVVASTEPWIEFYRQYTSQRSANITQTVRFERPINRVTARLGYSVTNLRDRPTLEIDTRVRRLLTSFIGGADIRVSPRTTIRAEYQRSGLTFRTGQLVGGANLADVLNRTGNDFLISARYSATVLTTVLLTAEKLTDHFETRPDRNSSGWRLMPGVEFSRYALMSGRASAGIRSFTPKNPLVKPFRGLGAASELSTTIRGSLRITGGFDRDIEYSYDVTVPYYLRTGANITGVQRVGERWEFVGAASVQRLANALGRPVTAAVAPGAASTSLKGTTGEVSAAYWFAPRLRLSFDARHNGRVTPVQHTTGWQVGSSVTYDF